MQRSCLHLAERDEKSIPSRRRSSTLVTLTTSTPLSPSLPESRIGTCVRTRRSTSVGPVPFRPVVPSHHSITLTVGGGRCLVSISSDPDLGRLGAVVDGGLLEPGMLERVLGRDSLLRVVEEDSTQQVQKLLVEARVGRDDVLRAHVVSSLSSRSSSTGQCTYLQALHGLDIFLRRLAGLGVWII